MNDGLFMQGMDAHQQLVGDLQDRLERKPLAAALEEVFQGGTHQLHHHHVVQVQMVAEKIYLQGRQGKEELMRMARWRRAKNVLHSQFLSVVFHSSGGRPYRANPAGPFQLAVYFVLVP
jgi:hypothetical protein